MGAADLGVEVEGVGVGVQDGLPGPEPEAAEDDHCAVVDEADVARAGGGGRAQRLHRPPPQRPGRTPCSRRPLRGEAKG